MKLQLHMITTAVTLLVMMTGAFVNTGRAQTYWNTTHLENWDSSVPVNDIPYRQITHLIFFAGGTGGTQTNTPAPYWHPPANFTTGYLASVKIAAHAAGTRVIADLGLGGGWDNVANSGDAAIDVWAGTVAAYLISNGFDGGDFDLEGSSPVAANMKKMYRRLHDTLAVLSPSKHYTLSASVLSNTGSLTGYGIVGGSDPGYQYLDQINPMFYDVSGSFASPLYQDPSCPTWGSDSGVSTSFVSAGIPIGKIGLGYAIQVYQTSGTALCPPGGIGGYYYMNNVHKYFPPATGATIVFNNVNKEPTVVNTVSNLRIAYEDTISTWYKADFIKRKGFGGAMGFCIARGYWSGGTTQGEKNMAAYGMGKALNGGGIPPPPPVETIPPVVQLLTPPASGDSVSGNVTLTANATDNIGVMGVDFMVNGSLVGTDALTPYSFVWNTAGLAGQQTLTARAYDAAGNSATTPGVIVYVKIAPPVLPVTPALVAPANGAANQSTSPVLSWNISSGSTSYHLQVSTTSLFSTMLVDDSSLTATSKQLTALTIATTYYWRASAKNSTGISAYSSVWSFTVVSTPPPTGQLISGFTLVQLNGTSITGFDPISNGAILSLKHLPTAFAIRANTNPSIVGSVQFSSPAAHTENIAPYSYPNDNSAGTYYQWIVAAGQNYTIAATPYTGSSAGGTMGTGLSITVKVFADTTSTTPPPPSAPSTPVPVAPANSSPNQATTLVLSWNASTGATGYTLQVSVVSSFSSFVVNDSTLTSATRSVSALINSTTYYWRVSAKNSSGTSPYSAVWSFTTVPLSPPPASSDLWVYQDALQSPWLNWSWGSTNVPNSTEQVYAGSFAWKSTQTAWGAISPYSGTAVNPLLYSSMSFLIYPVTVGLGLNVFLQSNQKSGTLPNVFISSSNLPLNQWTIVSIPLSQLDPANLPINRINIMNNGGSQVYFLDQLRFVGNAVALQQMKFVQDQTVAETASRATDLLEQNSPNPFNPTTNFTFRIANPGHVMLKIYDMAGREVVTLIDNEKPAGEYTIQWDASNLSSGVYLYRLTSGGFSSIKKLMLLK